jgi:hypothetical protein
MQPPNRWKNLPQAAPIADGNARSGTSKAIISLIFSIGTGLADQERRGFVARRLGVLVMLPAVGASLALEAIQSLISPQTASSQPVGAGGFGLDESSRVATSPVAVSGSSSALISSDNLNALIDAQSLAAGNLGFALGADNSASDSAQSLSSLASGTASSAYGAANQLAQSTAIPVGLSVSV